MKSLFNNCQIQKTKSFFRYFLIAGISIALSACLGGKPPEEELKGAKNAIEEARAAKAMERAPELLNSAMDALANAESEIEAQSKELLKKDYSNAISLLSTAKLMADSAKAVALSWTEEEIKAVELQEKIDSSKVYHATKDDAEHKVNAVYKLYKSKKKAGHSSSDLKAAMDKLKEAKKAFKANDFNTAVAISEEAKGLLE